MSVKKRRWGPNKEAWVVRYTDGEGKRRLKTFKHKKLADAFEARAKTEVGESTHVADSATVTVGEAADLWLKTKRGESLEATTLDQYQQHVDLHIKPFIGHTKLIQLNVRGFEDKLREADRSRTMIQYVVRTLGSILADAQDRKLVVRNAVRERARRRAKRGERRANGKLKIGVDIPAPDEIRVFLEALQGRWRPLFLTLIFTGLRSSELRGLRWTDVDLKAARLHVIQRADVYRQIGRTKSDAGERTIPLPPMAVNTLKEWKLACPKGPLGLVFPNNIGNIESHANIINRGLHPLMLAAGLTKPVLDKEGKPALDEKGKPKIGPKYTGLHAFRHFYASWCINRKADNGLELPLKVVQTRLGHASITLTADRYGHLFPNTDDGSELAAAETALLAARPA